MKINVLRMVDPGTGSMTASSKNVEGAYAVLRAQALMSGYPALATRLPQYGGRPLAHIAAAEGGLK